MATGNANQAAVGAISPYLNKVIKEQTTYADGTVNTEANLIAHAILGAIEAKVTGNNALAGGLGALTAEAAAPYIMQALYGTKAPENLTEAQKQNIANLSQIAAGLSGGLVGDSTASFNSSAEIGKRAVENNFLSRIEWERLAYLSNKKILTYEEALEIERLRVKDINSEFLLDKYQKQQKGGEPLTVKKQEQLFKWIREYGSVPEQMMRINQPAFSAELRPNYSEMYHNAKKVIYHENSIQAQLANSMYTAEQLLLTRNFLGLASSSSKAVVGAAGVTSAGAQYYFDKSVDPKNVLLDMGTAYLSQYTGWKGVAVLGAGSGALSHYWDDKDWREGALLGTTSALASLKIGETVEKTLDKAFNPAIKMSYFEPYPRYPFILQEPKKSITPVMVSETFSGFSGKVIENTTEKQIKEIKDAKK